MRASVPTAAPPASTTSAAGTEPLPEPVGEINSAEAPGGDVGVKDLRAMVAEALDV